jgi:hypothetical protein
VFPNSSKRPYSNSKGSSEGRISSSYGTRGLREGSRAESKVVGSGRSDLAARMSS